MADPVPQVYRALVAHYDQWHDPKRAEAEAEAWRRPSAGPEPLLYLIRAAERRGASRKALALLAEAEALDRVHPEAVRAAFASSSPALSVVSKKAAASPSTISSAWRTNPAPVKATTSLSAGTALDRCPAVGTPGAAPLEQALTTTAANPVLQGLILKRLVRR